MAGQPAPSTDASLLYDRPVVVIDTGMHTSMIRRAAVDAAGVWAATASDDKTVRIWSVSDGALARTIRLPSGPSYGAARCLAMSPDGTIVAVGGTEPSRREGDAGQIHLFAREGDAVVRYLADLDASVAHLAFSPDGALLVATLQASGLRIYARDEGWAEVARDASMERPSYWADFAGDGRLAATTADELRLYDRDLSGALVPIAIRQTEPRPVGAAFSPDGSRLAVGYETRLAVEILDGHTLEPSAEAPDCGGMDDGDLASVAWSSDGRTLLAGGVYPPTVSADSPTRKTVVAWDGRGTESPRFLPAGKTTIMAILPLPDGDLLVASGDPWWARLGPDGTVRWVKEQAKADFRGLGMSLGLKLSHGGGEVAFGYDAFGQSPARFALETRILTAGASAEERLVGPPQDGDGVDMRKKSRPAFKGRPLEIWRREYARCWCSTPDGGVVMGSDWSLRVFDAQARLRWRVHQPETVWAVSVTGDGRLVVTANGDGTIRWRRLEDGQELLAFMPFPGDDRWALWTPEGFYATEGAHALLRWHINRGAAAPAEAISIASIPGSYRPAVLPLVIAERDIGRALGVAALIDHRRRLTQRIGNEVPDAELFLLTIGIAAYNDAHAPSLKLEFADRDAQDLLSVLYATQRTLYRDVHPDAPLTNERATKGGILQAFTRLKLNMERSRGQALAVVYYSGHGALIDDQLWLLPHDVDARDNDAICATALSAHEFRDRVLKLAALGRVLLILDACHSGGVMNDGSALVMNGTTLKTYLAAENVTILTSSSQAEVSREDPVLEHGIFTKVLLDVFTDPDADPQNIGLITATALVNYVSSRVSGLTGQRQRPDFQISKSDPILFASRL